MEYASGGELFHRIAEVGAFAEDEARYFFQQLISGVAWCHRQVSRALGGMRVVTFPGRSRARTHLARGMVPPEGQGS